VIKADGTPVIGIAGDVAVSHNMTLDLVFEKTSAVGTLTPDKSPSASHGVQRDRRDENTAGATKILGGAANPEFKDQAPDDGLLIGFEIGLGPAFGVELVKAIRPIYRTGDKESLGRQYGTAPKNVVVVKAKEGYAVGGMTVRSGLVVNGFSVTFMRVLVGKLDPSDSYQSDWIGDRTGGSETTLKGDGTPIIGIVGKASDKECTGIGLLFDK
jgi:hypothetical protein